MFASRIANNRKLLFKLFNVIFVLLINLKQNIFMTKEELISKIASDAKITKVQARAALASFVDCVGKTLKKGGRLSLVGFGTFMRSNRKARIGRNPRTGKELKIAAKKVARFKVGKALADYVR